MADQVASFPLASVAILTYNGEDYLRRILDAVSAQEVDGDVEILVIDSGSTDGTLQIVSEFPDVRLHEIPNSEFGHGRTRNLAASLATGEFMVYLTHDAVPLGPHWLRELLAPFSLNEKVVAVMGKQVPRPGCFPLLKYEIQGVFSQFGPDFGTTLFYKDDFVVDDALLNAISFYSDVNSATRRRFLLDVIPYHDVRYAEDQMFGKDVIESGYIKAYAPRGAVEHSNDLTFAEYGPRIFDETVGLRQLGMPVGELSRGGMVRLIVRGAAADTVRLSRDRSYTWKRRLYWLALNPFFHIRKWRAYRSAVTVDLNDEATIRKGSLEHSRKRP